MALVMSSLYDALRSAGATDETARKAAEEVESYDNRTTKIEGDLVLLKWMVGFDIAVTVAVLLKLLS